MFINLGGQDRELILNLGTMKHFKKLTGKSLIAGGLDNVDEEIIGAFLFSCLHRADKTITMDDVDNWVTPSELIKVSEKMGDLLKDFYPEADEESPLA